MKILKDKIVRMPANATAGRVLAKGEHHEHAVKDMGDESDYPLPMIEVPGNCEDLRGIRFGRFVVMGRSEKSSWVVRCDCGRYAKRKTKAIKNTENRGDRCRVCWQAAYKQKTREWLQTGRQLDARDL